MERLLLSIEDFPWSILYRAAIGFFVLWAFSRLFGEGGNWGKLVLFFSGILVALRVVPGIARRVLPFSSEAKAVWAARRILARRYDSYQWRKLFGLGLGLGAYGLSTGKLHDFSLALALVCLVSGGLGQIVWRKRSGILVQQTQTGTPSN